MKVSYNLLIFSLLIATNLNSQAISEVFPPESDVNTPASKKAKISSTGDKSAPCGVDTLYYSRHNLTGYSPKYMNLQPTAGAGMYFAVDDTVWLRGFNFFGYVQDAIGFLTSQLVTCKVYYANNNRLPAGIPLATGTHNFQAFGTSNNQLRQKFLFSSPVMLVSDFVVTIEFQANLNNRVVLAANDYDSADGHGNFYSAIKFTNGWSNNLVVGTTPFDSDFYFEPVVEYNMSANFDHGTNSCLGNGLPFKFVNTTTFALNPQFSKEAIDSTLDDNFVWDYGDGSLTDTILHGDHYYTGTLGYYVILSASFKNWRDITCEADTTIFLDVSDVKANFSSSANGLIVSFTDKSTNAKSWEWDFGDGSTGSVQQNPNHMFSNYGLYGVKQKARDKGCVDSVILWINLKDPTGLDELNNDQAQIDLSPNPASDKVLLQSSGTNTEGVTWTLFNVQGKQMKSGYFVKSEEVSVSEIPSGLYFIKFQAGNSLITKRLILK